MVTVDFNHRRPISSGISRGRKKMEKKRENLEIRHCPIDPDPCLRASCGENLRRSRGDFFFPRGLLGEQTSLLPSLGEETFEVFDEEPGDDEESAQR
ncbi:hypothetical protein B296_00011882 [Ensete ventricosum]|uniref:Uncharacterized protein n=1 Tax=Ensete ventricosum TaxID=4639 RepID=A0A426ZGZ7_ENSVE|nr:hypothetical protein B296_00011882 [Ensete ventricosum]